MSDIIYYSNHCKHSQKIIQYLVKNSLSDNISFICIDKRSRDPVSGHINVLLENGKKVLLPPNIHSVPSMLIVNQNYRVVLGDDIIDLFKPKVVENNNNATGHQGEPSGYMFQSNNNGMNIMSEQYTYYNMSPEELSAKGKGGMRQMHNYVKANHEPVYINTPPDNYRPDKISSNVTLDNLQQKRNDEVSPASSII